MSCLLDALERYATPFMALYGHRLTDAHRDAKHWCWRTPKNGFLFAHKALAKVFRVRMMDGMSKAGLLPVKPLPKNWVVDCRQIGNGLPALKYLSRYLYRGVITDKQVIADDGESVTFTYRDARTDQQQTRTVSGARFIWLLIQHVLPTSFRRVRDYGFLHGNARNTLLRVQWFLNVIILPEIPAPKRPPFHCRLCGHAMKQIGFIPPFRGYG